MILCFHFRHPTVLEIWEHTVGHSSYEARMRREESVDHEGSRVHVFKCRQIAQTAQGRGHSGTQWSLQSINRSSLRRRISLVYIKTKYLKKR